ncbi:MAG: alpha/beta hydrolase [Chloroflexi bacterium]|nr:MAG: alpha/beta hydrolase [Chloroflexota bacterium]
MKTIAPEDHAQADAAVERYSTGSVVSKDGTIIGYRQVGHGPAVILLHGAMESAQSHMQVAEALADRFTIYLPDRRGRGLSGPYREDHSIETYVQDMAALLAKTGAHDVMGVSSGAIIWLQAALTLPAIRKAVIFEPPLPINGSLPTAFMHRYDTEIAQGEVAAALVSAMKGTQMGPPIFNVIPRTLLERLTTAMMASEEKKAGSQDVTMRMLAPTLHYDFQLATEVEGALERFKGIRAEVLLLGGSKSPAYLKAGLDALEKVLPHVTRVELPGLGHGATGNTDRGGRPERAAQVLRQFFS